MQLCRGGQRTNTLIKDATFWSNCVEHLWMGGPKVNECKHRIQKKGFNKHMSTMGCDLSSEAKLEFLSG
jgi:hypothetical protein